MEEASSGSQSSPGDGSAEQDDAGEGDARFFQGVPPREQEMFLPIANISRIMRRVLPANAKIAKESRESLQECITEFIGFITSEANDKCLKDKRKTINGDDLIWAMATLGFENYVELLKVYLHRYKELEGNNVVSVGSRCGPESLLKNDEGGSVNFPDGQD